MVNESQKKKIYDALRGQVSARLIRAMDIAEADIGTLSLGACPRNALFSDFCAVSY
jgi:hypothetical protein